MLMAVVAQVVALVVAGGWWLVSCSVARLVAVTVMASVMAAAAVAAAVAAGASVVIGWNQHAPGTCRCKCAS